MTGDVDTDTRLRLAVQTALLGAVPPSLRAVTCDWQDVQIRVRFLFDGEITPEAAEDAQVAGTEIVADFPAPWYIVEEIERLDYPADRNERALRLWAYARKEA